jgi:hypothetical protein
MKPRQKCQEWVCRVAGGVLAAALAWSGWVAAIGAGPLAGGLKAPVAVSGGPNLAWYIAETLEKVPRRAWTGTADERRGMFERPETGPQPAALPRLRRREVELVATRELPYRLQLIGHFGEGAGLRGIFEAEGLAGPWLARAGDELPGLGVTVKELVLGRGDDGSPPRVVARIWDRPADRPVELLESVRVASGLGVALLAPAGYPGEAIELRTGDVVEVDGNEFRVESIRVSPAAVRLRRLAVSEPEDAVEELAMVNQEGAES